MRFPPAVPGLMTFSLASSRRDYRLPLALITIAEANVQRSPSLGRRLLSSRAALFHADFVEDYFTHYGASPARRRGHDFRTPNADLIRFTFISARGDEWFHGLFAASNCSLLALPASIIDDAARFSFSISRIIRHFEVSIDFSTGSSFWSYYTGDAVE